MSCRPRFFFVAYRSRPVKCDFDGPCGHLSTPLFACHVPVLQLSLSRPGETYTVSGYAYGGGGIALTRVEVSFDDGKVKRDENKLSTHISCEHGLTRE